MHALMHLAGQLHYACTHALSRTVAVTVHFNKTLEAPSHNAQNNKVCKFVGALSSIIDSFSVRAEISNLEKLRGVLLYCTTELEIASVHTG